MFKWIAIFIFWSALRLKQIKGNTSLPIIGIVCHEEQASEGKSFISASYVKALEAAGARVAPIFLWRNEEYINRMVKSLNGILLQGGSAKYDVKGGYFQTAARVFSIVRRMNYRGDHIPILGVCLGFEFLSIYSNGMDLNTLDPCNVVGEMLPLNFTQGFRNSSLYGGASQQIIDILSKQNVTPNYHTYCLRTDARLRHPWRILSTNKDENGIEFVSSMETDGHMAAVQFHPERNAYIWDKVHCETTKPIIGVLCHEIDNKPPDCYIAASYVKAVEASGARVVPVFLSKPQQYYTSLADKVNGFLFPGGDALLNTRNGYYEAGKIIFDYALKINAEGDHFPILGVCLGMEFLASYSSPDNSSVLVTCKGMDDVMTNINFRQEYNTSSLYASASLNIIHILATQNVTANFHSYCLRPDTKLKYPWTILSTNKDGEQIDFVSSMEIQGQPIAAVQFHPEKNAWEWQKDHPSFEDGLLSSRHFYDWLVIESRKNNYSFADKKEETASLIYNYNAVFTGKNNGSYFTQKYIFTNSSTSAANIFVFSNWLPFLCAILSPLLVK